MKIQSLKAGKKGQINQMSENVILLGVAAIVLVILIVMLQELRDTDVVKKVNAANFTNETVTDLSQAFQNLGGATNVGCQAAIQFANNETGAILDMELVNFTIDGCQVRMSNTAEVIYNNSDINFTYSISYADEAFTTGNQTVVGLGTFGDFWTIIVLAVVAAVVIGIIFGLFGRPRRR